MVRHTVSAMWSSAALMRLAVRWMARRRCAGVVWFITKATVPAVAAAIAMPVMAAGILLVKCIIHNPFRQNFFSLFIVCVVSLHRARAATRCNVWKYRFYYLHNKSDFIIKQTMTIDIIHKNRRSNRPKFYG